MSPTRMLPLDRPTPILSGGQPRLTKDSFSTSMALGSSIAASSAWRACSGSSSGAPQNAMIASPMYLSMVPRCFWITLVSGVRKLFMSSDSSCGLSLNCSEMVVKPRTSENSTVISLDLPAMVNDSGLAAISATRSAGTYSPKRLVMSRERRVSMR